MHWVGILVTSLGMLCVIWLTYAIVRFKHVRVKRVLVTLEWLALTPKPAERQRPEDFLSGALQDVRDTWKRVQWVFGTGFHNYLFLVWNASSRDLYWANRFGAELVRLSQSLLPSDRFAEEYPEQRERYRLIAQHIWDFDKLAGHILLPRKTNQG